MTTAEELGGVTEELFADLLHQIFAAIMSTGEEDVFVQREFEAPEASLPQQGQIVASITINGDHLGIVNVVASPQTADSLALVMHGEPEADDEDRADALGEVANIIAGNAKGLMMGENQLGLPEVEFNRVTPSAAQVDDSWSWQIALPVGLITVHMSLTPQAA